ncbi:mandelate racemase/muconate lactonizing enzyme family protein [Allostreptomyces psammosilenae]|uniref:L-alanine-DL-glutamate epimerase-like enolase superfamily enzyme n=1 Tax=Allostreptomyces psammosilenae TaxID=1892865 RepID=A0A852ZY53_9ACTN|nr:mandelate racemase/muconate lactonizing enzyme family protein [Allostreptomyces psammosilenae]NYI03202.1 L-alanine-DL-glutamate epimerase-like enolase superfamily enzyme [Allostreptomyces psammosilenae]
MAIAPIAVVEATAHRVPLPRPWGPDVPANHLIVCTVTDEDGRTGTGFTWTPQIGAEAVHSMLLTEAAPAAVGLPAHPGAVWDVVWRHLREAGAGGVTTLALAAIDTALWDLRARAAGHGVIDEIGRRRDTIPAYGSGVNLHYPLDELLAQAERWTARGLPAIKVKVGRPDLDEDVERIAAVRAAIGPRTRLMIDANQRWDLPTARRAITALARYDLHWVEEPLPADDIAAHTALRQAVDVPIALGENVHTSYGFRDLLIAGACDIVQPNIARVGGITPLLRIAELARTWNIPTFPHLLPDVSAQLACTLPLPCMVEDVEDASFTALGLLTGEPPVHITAGTAHPGHHHGLGLTFDPQRLTTTRI